jgi:glycosyltransferase involved in cell wall biosynthesis
MQLSICITTKNRKSLLTGTLDFIFHKQNLPVSEFEVIVVNDGQDVLDDLTELFAGKPIRIIPNRGHGVATGRNTGALHAQSEIIIFYDDDILPSPHHFIRHIELQQLHIDWIITANRFYPEHLVRSAEQTPFGRYKIQYEYDWKTGMTKKNRIENNPGLYDTDLLAGFSVSMRKSTFKAIGGFAEDFEYASCEDAEFFNRAVEKQFKLVFDETNICFHNELDNFTLKKWLRRQANGIKGSVVMIFLHPEGKWHPTIYLNEPISSHDSFSRKLQKIRRYALSNWVARHVITSVISICEKIHLPDIFLFKLYNAAWIGETHHSFLQAYKEMFGEKKVE